MHKKQKQRITYLIMLTLHNYLLKCSLPICKRLILKSSKYPHTDGKFLFKDILAVSLSLPLHFIQ